jgi:exo-beta-1,3-glucanase (GH17 family)
MMLAAVAGLGAAARASPAQNHEVPPPCPGRTNNLLPFAPLRCGSWIAFAPPYPFNPNTGTFPSEDDLRVSLRQLFAEGWRGLVTYSLDGTLREVPRIAKEVGFEQVVAGVYWHDPDQLGKERTAVLEERSFIDGIVVGNEGLLGGRYSFAQLELEVGSLGAQTGLPVTTSEPPCKYINPSCGVEPGLLNLGDFLFPNVQPWCGGITDPIAAAQYVAAQVAALQAAAPDRVIVVKEAWWPTGGGHPAATEENQVIFFQNLVARQVPLVWGEAYDQYWKIDACPGNPGPHWGLHTSDGVPKLIIQALKPIFGCASCFYTVTPCRVVDTRTAAQPLLGGTERRFPVVGHCGVPSAATTVSANLTVTGATAPGHLRLSSDRSAAVSAINYTAGQTRANNALAGLTPAGEFVVRCFQDSGSVHLIVDVNGYFQ